MAISEQHPSNAGTHIEEEDSFLLSEHIFIKDNRTFRKFAIADIRWIKGDGSYCEIQTVSGKTVVRNTLKQFQPLLDEKGFMKVHRSYVVNLHHMTALSPKGIQMDEDTIPINKEIRKEIINKVRRIS